MLLLLLLVFANLAQVSDTVHRSPDITEVAETAADASDQAADREIAIARYSMSKHDYVAAIGRLRTLVTKYPASPWAEEALMRLAESYLVLLSEIPSGETSRRQFLTSEAQTAVAVLDRKFPTSHFSIEAHNALKSAGSIRSRMKNPGSVGLQNRRGRSCDDSALNSLRGCDEPS
jgi:outer membrane protein assembly factor BamD